MKNRFISAWLAIVMILSVVMGSLSAGIVYAEETVELTEKTVFSSEAMERKSNIPADAVSFGGSRYKLYTITSGATGSAAWNEAYEHCVALGGHLATITSSEEDSFLYSYVLSCNEQNAYFGLTDQNIEGVWQWVTGEPVSYINWNEYEPNYEHPGEDYGCYLYKYTDGTWNDDDFAPNSSYDAANYICEWDDVEEGDSDLLDISISVHETSSCTENDRIDTMYYACGNFFWDKKTGTDEVERTNYDICYVKVAATNSLEDDSILENADDSNVCIQLQAPDGFSFEPDTIVSETEFYYDLLASEKDQEITLECYPIYTEITPVSQCLEFKVSYQSDVLGNVEAQIEESTSELVCRKDAGMVTMRNSFYGNGNAVWNDRITPDFSGFGHSSYSYDDGLALISAAFSAASYKYEGILETLKRFGFSKISRYNYNPVNDQIVNSVDTDKVAAVFASKKMVIDGEIKTIIAVIVRGTVHTEWQGNFTIGKGTRHLGFESARGYLAPNMLTYLNKYASSNSADNKILITGHSRGAAVADLLVLDMVQKYGGKYAAQSDIYGYTFATPNSTKENTVSLQNIFNIVNEHDVVTDIPGGYGKVGVTYYINPDSGYLANTLSAFNNLTRNTVVFKKHENYESLKFFAQLLGRTTDWHYAKFRISGDFIALSLNIIADRKNSAKDVLQYFEKLYNDSSNDLRTVGDIAAEMMSKMGQKATSEVSTSNPIKDNIGSPHGIWSNHAMEFYYSWIKSAPVSAFASETYSEYQPSQVIVTVACPVDVELWNAAGQTIASIVNDEVVFGEEFSTVVEDKKYFFLPEDSYHFIIKGSDDGEVNLTVTEYDEDFTKESFASVRGLTISKDDVIVFSHDSSAENNDDRYRIMDRNGNIVPAEVLTGDKLDAYTVEVAMSGDGAVFGDGSYDEGALVILNALPQDNNFLGWYENDVLISEELAYVFECEESRTLEARFTNLLDFNDLRILQQYFAGYPIELPEFLTDIDGDGTLTRRDCMFLARYLNGWEQYELPNKKNS